MTDLWYNFVESESEVFNNLVKESKCLPNDLIEYPHQIGGHGLLFGNKCRILYSKEKSIVFKSVQSFPKGPHELRFYQHLFGQQLDDCTLIELRKFVPSFRGLYCNLSKTHLFIGLDNILENFRCPSICDIKVGCRTYTPKSSPSKIMVERAKYKWREEIGFLLTGIKVLDLVSDKQIYFDIFYGRSLSPSTIYDNGIRLFLGPNYKRSRMLARRFVSHLTRLANWFDNQDEYNFYGSSLLLAYDNCPHCNCSTCRPRSVVNSDSRTDDNHSTTNDHENGACCCNDNEIGDCDPLIIVYLVDFTRLEKVKQTKDANFLYGLNNLIRLFQRASIDSNFADNNFLQVEV